MASATLSLFVVLGLALGAGYFAHALFRRHKVSDVGFLLVLGVLAGPVLHLVDPAVLAPAMPFLSPLALVVVLFEGGLELAWSDIREHAPRALRMSLVVWTLSGALVGLAAWAVLGLPPALALLFGYAVAATGMLVVVPLLAHVHAPPEARVILTVETSLGDLLSVVVVTTASAMIVAGATPLSGAQLLASRFLVGGAVGLLAGIAWARVLHALEVERHVYPLTLGALLLAYAAAEVLGGSGFLAALAFGLFLGNAPALMKLGGVRHLSPLPASARGLQSDVIFLLRSVYFVFVGLSIPRSLLTPGFALASLALLAAIVVARVVGVMLAARRTPARPLLVAMMPRGLATAVVAAIPMTMGVAGTSSFPYYVFGVIVGADLATSAGLWIYLRRQGRASSSPAGTAS